METLVLGFDVREPFTGRNEWTEERRSQFLIRPEVPMQLSVDCDVWPAVAESPNENPLNLWNSVSEIVRRVPAVAWYGGVTPPAAIKIEALAEKESSRYWRDVFFGYLQPEDRGIRLSFEELGYDMADAWLVSGVSNCMLQPEELAEVRTEWAPKINALGLFGDADDAARFRIACDKRIPEHAPFCVYRISRVSIDPRSHDL